MSCNPPIYLTNTMGRRIEQLETAEPDRVRLYTCGPTVYSYAHIGNFRAFIVADTLRRMLEYNGYTVDQVRNITDVGHLTDDDVGSGEDKVEGAARRANRTPRDIADYYTAAYVSDAARLNIEPPTWSPRATEFVPSMISLIERLITTGMAYEADGSVYFDVSAFPSYGKLSGNTVEGLIAGARVEVEEGKRSPADFALWKAAGPEKLMRWDSPWGPGVPGWHLECSAMAMDLLGEQIDIHTGGVDHIFPHHEDEIAQSEGASGKPFARYWLHNEFLQFAEEKMSKSLGNIYTISDVVERGFHPLAFRYFAFQAHYRSPLTFTWTALEAAQTALCRVWEAAAELWQSAEPAEPGPDAGRFRDRFQQSINRDLDLPGAVAILHEVLGSQLPAGEKLSLLSDFDRVLALDLLLTAERLSATRREERALLAQREAARRDKDWTRADALRSQLTEGGLEVKDTPQGQRWIRTDVLQPGRGEDGE